jgi:hypothetical protein
MGDINKLLHSQYIQESFSFTKDYTYVNHDSLT